MAKFALYGGGGHALVVMDTLLLCGIFDEVVVFDDQSPTIQPQPQLPVANTRVTVKPGLGKSSSFERPSFPVIVSIGDNRVRQRLARQLASGPFGTVQHPSSVVSRYRVQVGVGSVILARAVVQTHTTIGEHVIINSGAVVEHGCKVGDFAHVSPNATLCGNVTVGEGSWVGAGAVVIQGIRIGVWCTIGAGTVVIRDVPDGVTVVGNPARIL